MIIALIGIFQVMMVIVVPAAVIYIFKSDIDLQSKCRYAVIVLTTIMAVFAMTRLISGFFLENTGFGMLANLSRIAADEIISERWELLGFSVFGVVSAALFAWLQIRAERHIETSDNAR